MDYVAIFDYHAIYIFYDIVFDYRMFEKPRPSRMSKQKIFQKKKELKLKKTMMRTFELFT